MPSPKQADVERRAYQLWEQAGEFYLEAEHQLKGEIIRYELLEGRYPV